MPLSNDELFEKIKHELNGKLDEKLDAKLAPIYGELKKIREEDFQLIHDRLDKIEKNVEANASNIKALQGDI